ncbi:MAG: Ig-like domain-containing protein [Roseiflexaceae bacterium]
MVGAHITVLGNDQLGAVYVYDRDFGGAGYWGERTRLLPQHEAIYWGFGNALAFDGDLALIGTPADQDDAYDTGSVFAFRLYPRPHAVNDTASTDEDTPVPIDVLTNDSTDAGTGSLDLASVRVVAAPAHGTTSVNTANGAITYAPLHDFNGTDSFIYSVGNTIGTSQTAPVTVTVRPVNDAPRFVSQPLAVASAHSPYRYTIVASDVDAGDVLAITAPIRPAWLTLGATISGTSVLSGTPTDADVGQHVVRLQVTDAGGVSATQPFTITVGPNRSPRFISVPPTRARDSAQYLYFIAVSDPDMGQALTIAAPVRPTWLTLNQGVQGTMVLSGTPDYTAVGEHMVRLQVVDPGGLSATQAFTITVDPNRPTPPRDLIAAPASASAIRMGWSDASYDEIGFSIERGSGAGTWTSIATVGAGVTSYVDTDLQCGTIYDYRVSAYNQHWASIPSNIASTTPSELTPRSFTSGDAPLALPALGQATARIAIADLGAIADLDVRVDIDYIYDSDLVLVLTAPDGTSVPLATRSGGPGHDYHGTIFDHEATMRVVDGYAPFSGRYHPQGSLGALSGKPIAGIWTLTVQNYGHFSGTVTSFGLDIATTAGCPGIPPTPTVTPLPAPTPTVTATPSPTVATPGTPSPTPSQPLAMVLTVGSDADTGDGQLSEGEIARVAIETLSVRFNTTNILGFKHDAFLLLAEGPQPGIQTTSCAHIDPGDQPLFSNFKTFLPPIRTIVLGFYLPGWSPLPDGRYRLIVCETVTGTYPLLDGDGDGLAGGDFVRNFTVERTPPTPTPTNTPWPSPEPTATPTATATSTIVPTSTPTSTPTATPDLLPRLLINYTSGRAGSSFTIIGAAFPPDTAAVVMVNGVQIGTVTSDHTGAIKLALDTAAEAKPGFYEVAIVLGASSAQHNGRQAKISYTLRPDSLVRTREQDDGMITLAVPANIQPRDSFRLYLPLMRSE